MSEIARQLLRDRAFVVCALVLGIPALVLQAATARGPIKIHKKSLPLRKELAEFDSSRLGPYKLIRAATIAPDVEEELGTTHHLQYFLDDTSIPNAETPGKYVSFFVTYYTGDPDQVPHVPDECYIGSGFQKSSSESITLTIPGIGLENDSLPIRLLIFENYTDVGVMRKPVIYFFSVNGAFLADRQRVRLRLTDLRYPYSYLSKVEITFDGYQYQLPNRDQAIELTKKFLRYALPILMKDHWPDWQAALASG